MNGAWIPVVVVTSLLFPTVTSRCGEVLKVRRGRSLTKNHSSAQVAVGETEVAVGETEVVVGETEVAVSETEVGDSEVEEFYSEDGVNGQTGRIVGGTFAVNGEFPWMVSLQENRVSSWVHSCGASLLAPGWLLTAAHCRTGFRRHGRALAGCLKRTASAGCQVTQVYHSDFIVHPNYNHRTMKNDIALIKLRTPYQLSLDGKPLNTICLPAASSPSQGLAVVAGWGMTRNSGQASMNLKRVNVNVVSNSICSLQYGQVDPGSQVCAGVLSGGRDSCQGDSGGPLMRWSRNAKSWSQIGIVSFGDVCGKKGSPAVYTKVAAYKSWINKYVTR